ncbi:hypothetical protein BCY91_08470 [Pelobium manganitolerans]|uniref:Lipocalin-like domain-containing protein n=1 Tax=Pelobium manganitolerans TaxID=1842495 RepID=A0A419S4Q9_9SPHI|nr:hypothetical protein [Pelobium manganitolerans]RKD14495.1 hypothetical protein BCY91_08470 [Pelobium manganitolerans]
MKNTLFILIFFICACTASVKQEDLIGRWNYVSYAYENKSLDKPLANIASQKPFIQFFEDGKCRIVSSGKTLSEGTYTLDGKIIRYMEELPDGQTRPVPFLIKSLSAEELVFQTMDAEVKIITAKKAK